MARQAAAAARLVSMPVAGLSASSPARAL